MDTRKSERQAMLTGVIVVVAILVIGGLGLWIGMQK